MDIGVSIRFDDSYGYALRDLPARVTAIEESGFFSVWYPDHLLTFKNYSPEFPYPYSPDGAPPIDTFQPWFDCQLVLASMAAITTRIRLGTSVLILPQRNPLVTAKELATLDHLSHGRLDVGVGVGWSGDEFAALGVPFGRRGARTDEYLEVMKLLWEGKPGTHEGEFVSFGGAIMRPPPRQRPHPPLFVGGESRAAMRRAARLGNGWISGVVTTEKLASSLESLDAACDAAGRDPAGVRRVFMSMYRNAADLERQMAAAEELGVDEMVLIIRSRLLGDPDPDGTLGEIARVVGLTGAPAPRPQPHE